MAGKVIGANGITDSGDWENLVREADELADIVAASGYGFSGQYDEEEEIPEDELTDDEKRIKRMAVEYDLLTERLERLTAFRATDTYKQLPEDSRSLIDKSCKAMEDDQTHLRRSIELECDNMNKKQAQE